MKFTPNLVVSAKPAKIQTPSALPPTNLSVTAKKVIYAAVMGLVFLKKNVFGKVSTNFLKETSGNKLLRTSEENISPSQIYANK